VSAITITPYTRRERHLVHDLIFRNSYVHTHLDWQDTDQWLESAASPMCLAWQYGRLVGAMAASLPLDETCWIRLAALNDYGDRRAIFDLLWRSLSAELRGLGIKTVALLILRDWLEPFALSLGFSHIEDVITLRRADRALPDIAVPPDLSLRPVREDDLPAVTRIDQAAFLPPWQMTAGEIRQAVKAAAYCTVALRHEALVGYQISTVYFDGAHLARLAVMPEMQGAGIGAALLLDDLRRFARRGVYSMTVNTQSGNTRSQRLYERYGFQRNGYDLPVWMLELG
jgi:ribosomal-protein-alanine N-acetyltransferase